MPKSRDLEPAQQLQSISDTQTKDVAKVRTSLTCGQLDSARKRRTSEADSSNFIPDFPLHSKKLLPEERVKRKRAAELKVDSRQYQMQDQFNWHSIDEQMFPTPSKDEPDVENDVKLPGDQASAMTSPKYPRTNRPGVLQEINAKQSPMPAPYQFRNVLTPGPHQRASPLPALSWAEADHVWGSMVAKEAVYKRCGVYMSRHSELTPRMRSILFDWMMEVCTEFTMLRETFYLSVEYVDRYLSVVQNIHKARLQLVGVAALFIAAKLEEIYPPKLTEFSYITDGCCSIHDIESQELIMLSYLKWSLSPVTPVSWLNLYLQTDHARKTPSSNLETFIIPGYSQETFVHISQLIDLCTLDLHSLDFSTGVLAAAALYHFTSEKLATQASGFKFEEIAACVCWMTPFVMTVRDVGLQSLPTNLCPKLQGDWHHYQTYSNTLDTLDKAIEKPKCESPVDLGVMITPPKSGQKQTITAPLDGVCIG